MSDGKITITIHNPNLSAVLVTFNGQTNYDQNPAPKEVSIIIDELGVGAYDIAGYITECGDAFNDKIFIESEQLTNVLESYEDNKCVFYQMCKDQYIPGSTLSYEPTFDYNHAHSNLFDRCQVPILCNYQEVGTHYTNHVTVTAAEYFMLLGEASIYFTPEYVETLFNRFNKYYGSDCDLVTFCPLDMEMSGGILNYETILFSPSASEDPDNPGCFSLDCSPLIPFLDNDFCVDESFQTNFPTSGSGVVDQCLPARVNIAQLIENMDQIQGIQGTELAGFLTSAEAQENAMCSYVVFCRTDFSVLYTDIRENCCDDV
jgi:hypothetical protein